MKCFGLTKTSNHLKFCKNKAKFLYCWQHVWQPFILIGVLIGFGASIAGLSGYSLKDVWLRIYRVKPKISCVMEYPIKSEEYPSQIGSNSESSIERPHLILSFGFFLIPARRNSFVE